MRAAFDALVVLGCVLGGWRLPPARALLLLTGVVVLLPAGLQLPTGFTPLPTATRLTALAVGAGLLRRREPDLFAATPLNLAAGLYAGVTLLTGVLLAPAELPLGISLPSWLDLLDPLLVGLVALAAARAAGPRAALRALGIVGLVAVVAGLFEHVTGAALSRLLVRADGLELRAGATRIRVGSDFALAFAWTVAALIPAVVVLLRRRGPALACGLLGCLGAAYWSFSRSVPIGIAAGLLVLLLGIRDRRVTLAVLLVGVVCSTLVVSSPSLRDRFTASVDQGALDVRAERAPVVLDAVSKRPVAGLGLGGVAQLHIGETDDSYLLGYAETGIPGVIALLVLVVTGLVLCSRGLRGPPSAGRRTAAVGLAGGIVLLLGAAVFDALSVRGTSELLGLLVGCGAAAAEQVAGRPPRARPTRDLAAARVLFVGLAVAGGMVVATVWPSHVAVVVQFDTLSAADQVPSYDKVDDGRRLIATACAVATAGPPTGVRVQCRDSNT
ncbi:MAG: O-Antigen ligase, partial [Frankiales bacterium]|nr:O-Antigen ligase [Frankiales bacterium]